MKNKNIPNLNLYQTSNQTGLAIEENFIVRTIEFERIMDSVLKDAKAQDDSVQHFLLLGRRGSGKSTLLKRIEYEIATRQEDYHNMIPINLAEEQAGISRLFDVFEVVLRELIDRGLDASMPEDKLFLNDSSEVAQLLFREIHRPLTQAKQRVVLLIDNIDKIFDSFGDDAHVLREILINHADFKIIGASTRMNEHFWQYDKSFYQFFRVIKLEALSMIEIEKLLLHWSKQYDNPRIATFVKNHPAKIKTIRQLTDGLPRTLKYFIQVLIQDMGLETYEYLQGILDKITPLYQERLNTLSTGQRKIVYNLAFIWEATEVASLAQRCRMKSNEASAFLKQLTEQNIVDKITTDGRNHLYLLSERFFNLWIVMTQGSPSEKRSAKYLTQFLELWYDEDDIKRMARQQLQLLDKEDGDMVKQLHLSKALVHSKYMDVETYDALIEKSRAVSVLNKAWVQFPETFAEVKTKLYILIKEEKYNKAIQLAKSLGLENGVKDFIIGTLFMLKGDVTASENSFLKAIEKGFADALYNLAFLYDEQGRTAEAENYYLKAIEMEDIDALNSLAILNGEQGRKAKAETYYLKAIEKKHVGALNNLANLYSDLGRKAEAETYYLKAIEKEQVDALSNLANLYVDLGRTAEAETYYLKAIEKEDVRTLNNLANLYREQGRTAEAETYYLKAIEKENVHALNNLANLYGEQGRIAEAEIYYLKAIEKEHVEALSNLAILYSVQGLAAQAETYYLKAIEREHVEALYNLAYFYYKQNINKEKAWELALAYQAKEQETRTFSLQLILQLWKGDLKNINNHLEKILSEEELGIMVLSELLIHHQTNLVRQIFTTWEKASEYRQKFLPIYYALFEVEKEKSTRKERLKIPPELVEMRDEIVAYIRERRAVYYPDR